MGKGGEGWGGRRRGRATGDLRHQRGPDGTGAAPAALAVRSERPDCADARRRRSHSVEARYVGSAADEFPDLQARTAGSPEGRGSPRSPRPLISGALTGDALGSRARAQVAEGARAAAE